MISIRPGDVCVVDASEYAVRSGRTDPSILSSWRKKGARVFSSPQLHAKVFVFGSTAFVGSTNVSRNSQVGLIEATLRTTSASAVPDAKNFILALMDSSQELFPGEINRLETLFRPAKQTGAIGQRTQPVTAASISGNERLLIFHPTENLSFEAEQWKTSFRSTYRAANSVFSSQIDVYEFEEEFFKEKRIRPGDIIVNSYGDVTHRHVFGPALVIQTSQVSHGRSAPTWAIGCIRPSGLRVVAFSRIESSYKKFGLSEAIICGEVPTRKGGPLLRSLWPSLGTKPSD